MGRREYCGKKEQKKLYDENVAMERKKHDALLYKSIAILQSVARMYLVRVNLYNKRLGIKILNESAWTIQV